MHSGAAQVGIPATYITHHWIDELVIINVSFVLTKHLLVEMSTHVSHYISPPKKRPSARPITRSDCESFFLYYCACVVINSIRLRWAVCRRGTWCNGCWVLFCLLLKPRVRKTTLGFRFLTSRPTPKWRLSHYYEHMLKTVLYIQQFSVNTVWPLNNFPIL